MSGPCIIESISSGPPECQIIFSNRRLTDSMEIIVLDIQLYDGWDFSLSKCHNVISLLLPLSSGSFATTKHIHKEVGAAEPPVHIELFY